MAFLAECRRQQASRQSKPSMSLCDIALGIGDGNIMPMPFGELEALPHWDIPVPPEPEPVHTPQCAADGSGAEVPLPRIKGKSSRLAPSAEEALNRSAVLGTWIHITEVMGPAFRINAHHDSWNEERMEDYFATRRTGTLSAHASAWRLFLKYSTDAGLVAAELDEARAHQYLKHLLDIGAPATRASAFLKSCNFAFGLCSFTAGSDIASSARCKGLAAKALKGKRRRKQRRPLQAKWLRLLEQAVVDASEGQGILTLQEGVVAGFLVFSAHGRARCSDAARVVSEPTLDEEEDGDPEASFLEAETQGSQVKTGNTSQKADLAMPIVALSRGISDTPWGAAWLSLRRQLCLDAALDECLMPEPLADGTFGEGRIQAGQATTWLRHLLLKLEVPPEELTEVGSHSCKATILSITAKAGLSKDVRRTLGGHATPGDTSVDVYSRDVIAAPLRQVALLFTKVRAKLFDPDSSRSGRWRKAAAPMMRTESNRCCSCEQVLQPNDSVFRCSCGGWVHLEGLCGAKCWHCNADICSGCDAGSLHVCKLWDDISDADGEELSSSSDGEQAAMVAEEAEAALEADSRDMFRKAEGGADAIFPAEGIFVHKLKSTAHRLRDAHFTGCGIHADPLKYLFIFEGFDAGIPRENLCWRAGCTPWTCVQAPLPEAAAVCFRPKSRRKLK